MRGLLVRFDVDGPGTRTATTTLGGGFINCQTKRQQVRGGGSIVRNFTVLFKYV